MRVVYRISEQDYISAHDLFAANEPWYRRFSRRLMVWLGVLMLATQALYLIVVPHRDRGLVVVWGLMSFFLLYCGFALRRYFRRSYQKDHRFKHDFTAEISDAGVRIVTPFSDSQMKWNTFVRFLESDTIFMVFVAEWSFVIFPKRAFAADEGDQFRGFLQQNIAPLAQE